MCATIKSVFKVIGFLGAFAFTSLQASTWVGCHGCGDSAKELKARGFQQINQSVRVNVLDAENQVLTTYNVANLTEYEPGSEFSRTFVVPVTSTSEELQARDLAIAFYQEAKNVGTIVDAGDLGGNVGDTYTNAGYMVNSNNAANISTRLNDLYSGFMDSWNINMNQNMVGAFASAAKGLNVTVVFSDGSTARFELDAIFANLAADGSLTNGFTFEFKVREIKDKDGNVIPMTPDAAAGSTSSVSGSAAGAWNTAFSAMGISLSGYSSGGSGSSGGVYVIKCTVSGGKLTCTAERVKEN